MKHTAGEYVRKEFEWNADDTEAKVHLIHSNTVENVFSVFKRGMTGVYQHCSEKHLNRYVKEFEYRFNRRNRPETMLSELLLSFQR